MTAMHSASAFSAPERSVRAKLKWFDRSKGFGFVVVDRADVFLHGSVLRRAGIDALGEGAALECGVELTDKGANVKRIIRVVDIGLNPSSIAPEAANVSDAHVTGIVKWYKPNMGYGFVKADDGGVDIMLRGKVLARHGLDSIERNTPLMMIVKETPKGREVVEFQFA